MLTGIECDFLDLKKINLQPKKLYDHKEIFFRKNFQNFGRFLRKFREHNNEKLFSIGRLKFSTLFKRIQMKTNSHFSGCITKWMIKNLSETARNNETDEKYSN